MNIDELLAKLDVLMAGRPEQDPEMEEDTDCLLCHQTVNWEEWDPEECLFCSDCALEIVSAFPLVVETVRKLRDDVVSHKLALHAEQRITKTLAKHLDTANAEVIKLRAEAEHLQKQNEVLTELGKIKYRSTP